MEITLYKRKGCPRCEVLTKKLDATGLNYNVVDDEAEVLKIGKENKIMSAPILVVDDKVMDFSAAVKFITEPNFIK